MNVSAKAKDTRGTLCLQQQRKASPHRLSSQVLNLKCELATMLHAHDNAL